MNHAVKELAPEDRLLTPRQVAALFSVDPKTVTRWSKAGRITSIRTLGGHRRYSEVLVRKLIADRTEVMDEAAVAAATKGVEIAAWAVEVSA